MNWEIGENAARILQNMGAFKIHSCYFFVPIKILFVIQVQSPINLKLSFMLI
jgi:hypothetical protein